MEQNDDEIYILKEKDFILISDKNIQYKVKLFITNNDLFCINLFTNKINPSKKYSLSLGMDDLIKNRFFKIFINIDEIFRELENKIEKSNIIEDSNLIYLDIPIGLNVINDIILEIKESIKSNEEIIHELQSETNIKNIMIKEKDIKIKELENKLKEKENKIKELENKLNEKEELLKKEKENNYFTKSNIIQKKEEDMILKWFEKKPNKFIKILDSKIDGDKTQTFIEKCVNVSPIILFIKSKNGCRFGGFTSKTWLKDALQYDDKSFLFSLDRNEKYNITDPTGATRYSDNYFRFGNIAIQIENNCTSNNNNSVEHYRFETVPKNYGINGGQQKFTVDCYEVYKIIYS